MKTERKKRLVAILIALMAVVAATAFVVKKQNGASHVKNFNDSINAARMIEDVERFSKEDNARIAGFDGETNAGEYVRKQFEEAGLSVSVQEVPVKSFMPKSSELQICEPETRKIDSRIAFFSASAAPEGITAEVANAFKGKDEELEYANLNGKIALLDVGKEQYADKMDKIASKGAVGIILYDQNLSRLLSASVKGSSSAIPVMGIGGEDGKFIRDLLENDKKVTVKMKAECEIKNGTSRNIVGELKAKKQNKNTKTIVIGAHYDCVDTPGANDNASGVAVLLESCRILSQKKLDVNVRFIAFGAEELGLEGSKHYVSSLSQKEMSQIAAMINVDMVGAGDVLNICNSNEKYKSIPAETAEEACKKFGYLYERAIMAGSDHVSFEEKGVPSVFLKYGNDSNYHADEDTCANIDKNDLQRACNVAMAVIYGISKR